MIYYNTWVIGEHQLITTDSLVWSYDNEIMNIDSVGGHEYRNSWYHKQSQFTSEFSDQVMNHNWQGS